jgi:hypothetical protein
MERQQIARLAAELPADRIEGGEANRLGLAGLENRQIGQRDANAISELRSPRRLLRFLAGRWRWQTRKLLRCNDFR